MAGTQHTDALLGRSSVMSIAVSAGERVDVRDRLSPAPYLSLISRDGESPLKKTGIVLTHVMSGGGGGRKSSLPGGDRGVLGS